MGGTAYDSSWRGDVLTEPRSDDVRLDCPARLADLESSGLLDAATIQALDGLALAAHNVFGTRSTGAITALTADQAVIVSLFSGGEFSPPGSAVPVSHSMCKHVVTTGAPYRVDDATIVPDHAVAVRDHAVGAYLGFPLRGARGTVLGAVCAVTPDPHEWTAQEIAVMGSIAMAAEAVVAMHTAARAERMARTSGTVPLDASERMLHDLRTPLTSLLGFIELLLDDTDAGVFDDDQVVSLLRRSHANAQRLRDTVNHLRLPARSGAALPA